MRLQICDDRSQYESVSLLAAMGRRCSRGYRSVSDLKLVSRLEFGSGAVAMRYEREVGIPLWGRQQA